MLDMKKKSEYPIYCRKYKSLDNAEEIILDVNQLAEGYEYFAIGGMSVSPDNQWLAYGADTLSRRFYKIYFKHLPTGKVLEQTISDATGGIAWANDNETVFYTRKNKVTLLVKKFIDIRRVQIVKKMNLFMKKKMRPTTMEFIDLSPVLISLYITVARL